MLLRQDQLFLVLIVVDMLPFKFVCYSLPKKIVCYFTYVGFFLSLSIKKTSSKEFIVIYASCSNQLDPYMCSLFNNAKLMQLRKT